MTIRAALHRITFPTLIGDIGGTNARFALIEAEDAPVRSLPVVATASYRTIEKAIEDAVAAGTAPGARSAILALAGVIAGERVPLTNGHWTVEPKALIGRFGFEEVILLNDFEALALALPDLAGEDLDPIGNGTALAEGAKLVVGPGTGLGAGALVNAGGVWVPLPGEGGHISLAPETTRDFAIWPHIEGAGRRVSGEALLSGSGLVRLYRAVAASNGAAAALSTPEEITGAGLSGVDAQAAEALSLFATYLGRLAGDLALVVMAHGGVHLAGGITARIAPVIKSGGFREAFVDKPPHRALLDGMATAIVRKSEAALAGIAALAREPARFAMNLEGRRWRR